MYDQVIVRYGEIFLKSEYVKRQFEDRLIENIRQTLRRQKLEGKILRSRHRIHIQTDDAEAVAEAVCRVFGVVSTSPAKKTTSKLETLADEALKVAKEKLRDGDRFAVRAKRTGKHSYSSIDAEKAVADRIMADIKLKVDLTNPEKTIFVEIVGDEAYVFDKKIPGVGGLPYGSQGKVICLMSTGIDSPVAAWLMMHRGCEVVVLHLGAAEEIEKTVEVLESYAAHDIRVCAVPYGGILEKIAEKADRFTCVICKRTMLKFAKKMMDLEDAHGIVTGENLGQVASQTLENLEVLSEAASPIYRPVIGLDKEEIIEYAKRIGTYDFAKKAEKCPHVPEKPATRSEVAKIKALEAEIGVDEAVAEMRPECIKK